MSVVLVLFSHIRKRQLPSGNCLFWLRRKDLNQRPSGYEPDELPTALLRDILFFDFPLLITQTGYLSFGKPPCSIQKLLHASHLHFLTATEFLLRLLLPQAAARINPNELPTALLRDILFPLPFVLQLLDYITTL